MGDDEDDDGGIVWDRVWAALKDEDGYHPGRAITAARHELDFTDLVMHAVVALLFGYAYFVEGGYAVTDGLGMVAIFLLLAGITVTRAISDYYAHDEELAIKALRERYAADEISFGEFQRQVDRVVAGEDVDVFGDVDDAAGEDGPRRPASDEDPVEILRARYARGEVDDEEFERRLARLRETGDGPSGERSLGEREFEFER